MLRLLGASALTLLLGLNAARADLVVIAHPESGVDNLDQKTLVNIFMGRYQKLPSGISNNNNHCLLEFVILYIPIDSIGLL